MASPKWATPHRQAYLVELLRAYIGKTGWMLDLLTGEFYHPEYEEKVKPIIANWVADDGAEGQALWRVEQKAIHGLGERNFPLRGQFSAIAKDIFHASQPQYYLIGLGISGVTFTPFAKVRLASSFIGLHINLGDALKGVGKNKRRKAIRYSKPLPKDVQNRIDWLCRQAVRHYLS